MVVCSVNLAVPQTVFYNQRPVETGIFKKAVSEPIFLGKDGVQNDNVMDTVRHGGAEKACYLYGYEKQYSFWKKQYPNLAWEYGMLGENITLQELDEAAINIGDVFQIGEAIIQVSQPRQPCYKLGIRFNDPLMVAKFQQSPYPGIYVRVLQEGLVQPNDIMQLITKCTDSLSVLEVFRAIYDPQTAVSKIHQIINLQHIPSKLKLYLQQKYITQS